MAERYQTMSKRPGLFISWFNVFKASQKNGFSDTIAGKMPKSPDRQREHQFWMIGTLLLVPFACAFLAHGVGVCTTVYENTTVEGGAPWKRLLMNCQVNRLFANFQVVQESPYGRQIGAMAGFGDGPGIAGSINDDAPNLVLELSPDGKSWGVWTFPPVKNLPEIPPGHSA